MSKTREGEQLAELRALDGALRRAGRLADNLQRHQLSAAIAHARREAADLRASIMASGSRPIEDAPCFRR